MHKSTIDKAIRLCDVSNYSRNFFSRKQAEAFVEQLKKQSIKAIKLCDAVDDIYVRRSNEYYVNVKLGKSNPQISATISRILNKDKRVEGVLGSPGNWDVAIEGKDNAEYIKKILSGVGNIK